MWIADCGITQSCQSSIRNPKSEIRNPKSNLRQTIADRLSISRDNTVPVTLTTTADATQLVALRNQFRNSPEAFDGLVPSYTDLIAKIVATALQQHPALNSRWTDDGIVTLTAVHLGIAVDTDDGLLVPVLRDVESLSLRTVSRGTKQLVRRARDRSLTAEELQGGTFTITNLGGYGIDAFTPVINFPECAILGIGAIGKRPAVIDDAIVPRETVTLSLTFDHRIIDGAPAAKFLQAVRQRLENASRESPEFAETR